MARIIVVGSGGHARVLIEALRAEGLHELVGIADLAEKVGSTFEGLEVIGTEDDFERLAAQGVEGVVIGVGSVGLPSLRVRLAEQALAAGLALPPVVHPAAYVADGAVVEPGAFVAARAVIGAGARVGFCAIVNTGAVVDHDCRIGAFAHVAPGCALSGDVTVGDNTHLGTGTSVVHGVVIGEDSLIGAGSVVVGDIVDCVVAYGNPCRIVREACR